jgi:hypothetical protein
MWDAPLPLAHGELAASFEGFMLAGGDCHRT